MTQDLRKRYQDYKKLRVVEAAELIQGFLRDNGIAETGLYSCEQRELLDYLVALCYNLLHGHKSTED